ncbi:MAG: dihydrolipoyl dehydrogenase [Deltaproteobacteria bacterium]
MEKFNLTVIGSGPGGYIAAIRAAQLGMKVAIVERDKPGGVCLNWGCIPSKAILKCAEIYEIFKHAGDYGIKADNLTFDYSQVIGKSRKASATLTKGVEFLLKKNKITLFSGIGKLISRGRVGVSGEKGEVEVESERILIATGSVPRALPGMEIDGKLVLTSDEAIMSTDFPKSIIIVGGGYIGAEFAYVYHSFGSKVTIVEMEKNLIPGADREVALELERLFKKSGMNILTGTRYKSLAKRKDSVEVTLEDAAGVEMKIEASKLLVAIGRRAVANTAPSSLSYYGKSDDMGLKSLGIELTPQGFIKTDEDYMTTCSGVYAIGDIIGPPLLAHKASDEGVVAVERMHGMASKVHYDNIPACVYCQPEIGSVGHTEEQLKDRGIKYSVGKIPFRAIGKAVGTGDTDGFVKILSDVKTGEILGAHIIGHGATELIGEIAVSKTLESTALEIAITSHAHPTLSEGVMEAALAALGRARNF